MRFLPQPDNKFNHYENKYHLRNALNMLYENQNLTCSKFVKLLEKDDYRAVMPFVDSELMQSTMMSSVAFNLFATRTPSEIKTISDGINLGLSEEVLSRLRNSFIHGRYFYNYNDGFEIYDGTTSLSHITTINYDTLNKLADEVCKPMIEAYKSRKVKEIHDCMVK